MSARVAIYGLFFCSFRLWPRVMTPETGTESGENAELFTVHIPCRYLYVSITSRNYMASKFTRRETIHGRRQKRLS